MHETHTYYTPVPPPKIYIKRRSSVCAKRHPNHKHREDNKNKFAGGIDRKRKQFQRRKTKGNSHRGVSSSTIPSEVFFVLTFRFDFLLTYFWIFPRMITMVSYSPFLEFLLLLMTSWSEFHNLNHNFFETVQHLIWLFDKMIS